MADTCSQQDKVNSEDEEILLYVAKELIDHPLGFVIDAGGSIAKLVYRSKEDYIAGKAIKPLPNTDLGVLRLRYFNMKQVENVIDFLKDNCDVIIGDDDDEEEEEEWWITGITTQHFKKKIESAFRIKTKLLSEMIGLGNFMKNYEKFNSGCYDVDLEALSWVKEIGKHYYNIIKEWEKLDPTMEMKILTSNGPIDVLELFKTEVKEWRENVLPPTGKFKFPAILVHIGSTMSISLVSEDRKLVFVDFMSGMGKMICGLSEELTNESDFDKFIEMAERGNIDNVDLLCDDVRNIDHNEEDWYKPICIGHNTIFELGKLSSNNVIGKGNYNKDDLAIGILCAMIKIISKIAILNARIHNAKSVLFSGSLPKHGLVRHHLSRNLYLESVFKSLKGQGNMITIETIKYPGFVCALGVWIENVELNKKRIKKMLNKRKDN